MLFFLEGNPKNRVWGAQTYGETCFLITETAKPKNLSTVSGPKEQTL